MPKAPVRQCFIWFQVSPIDGGAVVPALRLPSRRLPFWLNVTSWVKQCAFSHPRIHYIAVQRAGCNKADAIEIIIWFQFTCLIVTELPLTAPEDTLILCLCFRRIHPQAAPQQSNYLFFLGGGEDRPVGISQQSLSARCLPSVSERRCGVSCRPVRAAAAPVGRPSWCEE